MKSITPLISGSVVAAVALSLACPRFAAAQTTGTASHWHPWFGCWSATPPRFVDLNAEPQQVCVVPAGASAVDLITITGARIVSRERIDPGVDRRPGEHDECTGWDNARWSADFRRVYLQSEYICKNGVKRTTTGLMATATNGDWLDIVGLSSDDKVGVRVLRHRPSPPLATLPADIAATVARDSRQPAELQTLLPIGDAEIIDASKYVNGAVIEAWLAENRQAFTMNAARLKTLARAGVDDRVIDILVALAYPGAFAIKPSPNSLGGLAIDGGGPPVFLSASPLLAGGFIFDSCDPFYRGLSLYGWDGCYYGSRYGYGPYGYYDGGWYAAGGGGGIIITPVPPPQAPSHGQVVNGRGYMAGDSGSSASGSSSSSSSSGGSSGSSGGSSSSSSGGERTAVPR
jgi:uncharacterized membrane protein YgcG